MTEYTKVEIRAIKSTIKMWTKIRDCDPSKYGWDIWDIKRAIWPQCQEEDCACYLCTCFNKHYNGVCLGCPLYINDIFCQDRGPFANLEYMEYIPQRKPHFKKYCQQIIDLCKEALEES